MQEFVLSFFQVQRQSHFATEVIFKSHKTFEKKNMLCLLLE
jgi:hypothetical protein